MADAVGYSHSIWLLTLFLVAATAQSVVVSTNTDLSGSGTSDKTTSAFNLQGGPCRISGSASVLVNSTLYFDGGEVAVQSCNSGQTNCTTWADFNNYLFAIPFNQPLQNTNWSSLPYTAISKPKSVPLTYRGVLLRNKAGTEFYKFGGGVLQNSTSPNFNNDTVGPTKIWKFGVDSLSWSSLSPALSTNWDLQYQSVPSLDKSFVLGSSPDDNTKTSMMVLDSSQTPEGSTRLSNIFGPPGSYEKGELLHLPAQSGQGVLLFIGGSVTLASGPVNGNPDVPMTSVRLFDIASGQWYNQSTSTDTPEGVFPNPRHNFCAVLASTGTKSYDIFMYGGDFNSVENESYSTGLWILSLPSFRWFYFGDPDTRTRLSGSTCQVIGPHFIRVGGWNYYSPDQSTGPTCMNALSIFNLNSFTWTDSFDPAATYKPPSKVAAWNAQNANPVSGWDAGVQLLFAHMNSTATVSPTPTPTLTPTPTPKPAARPLATILGAVLGGLVVIGLVLAGILVFIRRKKKTKKELENRFEIAEGNQKSYSEMPGHTVQSPVELAAHPGLFAGYPTETKNSKPGGQISELG